MLTGKIVEAYANAWEGVVFFSGRILEDTADMMAPIFLEATKNVKLLGDETKYAFIELFLTLLISFIEKPCSKYIPALYESSSDDIINHFIKSIKTQLINMDLNSKRIWWNSWLKTFLEYRKSNKPIELKESECSLLFMLLPELSFAIDDAVTILCKGLLPKSLDYLFWRNLDELKLVPDHSKSIAKLLTKLLVSISDLGYGENNIKHIVSLLNGLNDGEKKRLKEALLKHGIKTS